MKNKHFIISKDCKIVIGYNRSIIMDLTRESFFYIPNFFAKIVNNKIVDIEKVREKLNKDELTIFESLLDVLTKREILIYGDHDYLNLFSNISDEFDFPAIFTNLQFEESQPNPFDEDIINIISLLGIQAIEIRDVSISTIRNLNFLCKKSTIRSIELIIDYNSISSFNLEHILIDNTRLRKITIKNAPKNEYNKNEKTGADLIYTTENITNFSCGKISQKLFTIGVQMFNESNKHNNCLNKKLAIDSNGNFKNCLSMTKSYGSRYSIDPKDLLKNDEFIKHWKISKNLINVCSDCEYRSMCLDCRVFTNDKNNSVSKPSKCNYNPYISLWGNELGYKTEEECGISFKNGKTILNIEKLNQINKELWGEI